MKKQVQENIEPELFLKDNDRLASLQDLKDWIIDITEQGAVDFNLEKEMSTDWDWPCLDTCSLVAYKFREETDQEYEYRLERENREKERIQNSIKTIEQIEINQLKALKAKYPNI